MNKGYWENIYKKNIVPTKGSNFAKFVFRYIKQNNLEGCMLDVGCGNGRDTLYFNKNGIYCVGIDRAAKYSKHSNILKRDILNAEYEKYEFIYVRFLVHAISEYKLDALLEILKKCKSIIFIETRSTKGITLDDKIKISFNSGIGGAHFRMLYSKKYLTNKFKKKYNILYVSERKNFAKYNSDNPYCLRYIIVPK